MEYKNLGYFELFKSLFSIFENNVQTLNILLLLLELTFKNLKKWLRKLETSQIFVPIRFQYEEFNESEKSKFEDHLIYFLS
jgi:hypothetical protein